MVMTRSSAVSSHASSPSAQKPPCSSSSATAPPRKSKRRRTVAMPERKRKLRRQRALQKQIAIAKASQPVVTEETGKTSTKSSRSSRSKQPVLFSEPTDKLDSNPKADRQNSTMKCLKIVKNDLLSRNRGRKAPKKRAVLTTEKEKNPNSAENSRKLNRKREKRNQDAYLQTTSKKVRISESADACRGECDRDEGIEVNHGDGWTSKQDLALQNAYFQVCPSSNFWFEVSKKVPGKTANECFDRFYSAHPTPPTTQPRSRKLAAESPLRTISFLSPVPSLNSKVRFGRGKQGLLKAHQTVRHILRQQRIADGTYEADVFTAVEQFNPLLQDCTNRSISPVLALKGKDTSSESLLRTPASCFGAAKSESEVWWSVSSKLKPQSGHDENTYTTRSKLLSPEVLKAEQNPGRLDRFLDILHLRRVEKRKNTSVKGVLQDSNSKAERTFTQRVAAAREAIISEATEVLRTVQQQNTAVAEEETSFLSDHLEEEASLMSDD